MKAEDIIKALENCKGQHLQVVWARLCKTKQGSPSIVKRTVAHVRAGIDFSNLKKVKEGIESGERGEVQSLPWGEWKQFPFIIGHKGIDYVRLYPSVFANLRPKSEFYADGKPVPLDQIKSHLYASELPKDEEVDCFTVKAESVVEIG